MSSRRLHFAKERKVPRGVALGGPPDVPHGGAVRRHRACPAVGGHLHPARSPISTGNDALGVCGPRPLLERGDGCGQRPPPAPSRPSHQVEQQESIVTLKERGWRSGGPPRCAAARTGCSGLHGHRALSVKGWPCRVNPDFLLDDPERRKGVSLGHGRFAPVTIGLSLSDGFPRHGGHVHP